MEEGSAIAEHLVVASGRTTKHIHAVAQQLAGLLRAQGVKVLVKPHTRIAEACCGLGAVPPITSARLSCGQGEEVSVEGGRDDDWQVVDGGGCVFSLFLPATRQHYDLEGLWTGSDSSSSRMWTHADEDDDEAEEEYAGGGEDIDDLLTFDDGSERQRRRR